MSTSIFTYVWDDVNSTIQTIELKMDFLNSMCDFYNMDFTSKIKITAHMDLLDV